MEYYVSGGQAYQPDQLAHWLIQQCFGISLPRPTYVSPFAAYPPLPVGDIPTRLRQLKQPGKEITLNHAIRIRNVSNRGGEKQHYFALANRRLIVYNVLHRSYHFQYYFEGFVHQQLRQGNQLLNYTTYAPQPAQPNDVEQITKAIYQSFAYLPGETASRLRAMLTPEAIAGIAGFAALYLASQVTPIGWIADALGVGLFVWGVWVMGSEILEAAKLLKSFYQTATNARTDSDYQQAGKYFAQAISLIGVDTLMIILGNKAMKAAKPRVVRMMKGGAGEAPGSGASKVIEVAKEKADEVKASSEKVEPKSIKEIPVKYNADFTEVEIVDRQGNPIGEFDGIDMKNKAFIEDKSAQGLNKVNPRTNLPAQTPEQWAKKQITDKTEVRIKNLGQASATRGTKNGSKTIPSLDDIKGFKRLHYRLDSDESTLVKAVEGELKTLKTKYPDWDFSVQYKNN